MHLGNIEIAIREFFIRQGEDTKDWTFKIEDVKENGMDFIVSFFTVGNGWKTYEVLTIEEEDGVYFARL